MEVIRYTNNKIKVLYKKFNWKYRLNQFRQEPKRNTLFPFWAN